MHISLIFLCRVTLLEDNKTCSCLYIVAQFANNRITHLIPIHVTAILWFAKVNIFANLKISFRKKYLQRITRYMHDYIYESKYCSVFVKDLTNEPLYQMHTHAMYNMHLPSPVEPPFLQHGRIFSLVQFYCAYDGA